MDSSELDRYRSVEELSSRQSEVQERMKGLDLEFVGRPMTESARGEFVDLKRENDSINERVAELQQRQKVLASLGSGEGNREAHRELGRVFRGEAGDLNRPASARERDIFNLDSIRSELADPDRARGALRDRALRALEVATFPQTQPHLRGSRSPQMTDPDRIKGHIQALLDNYDESGEIAKRILVTGAPLYRKAFLKYLFGQEGASSPEEKRALALGAGGTGGYAIVYTLDPTFIPTSNLSVNPFRGIASLETISGTNEWRGVTQSGVTAAYADEAAEAVDATSGGNFLSQPDITVKRAQCFIPVSIELTQDLPSLQGSLAQVIQDAKDDLEASQFTNGSGSDPYPSGLVFALNGATNSVVQTGTTGGFAVADVYAVEAALPPRFRPRAVWLANRAIYSKVRQFDTSGGAAMWLGYPNPMQEGLPNNVPEGGNTGVTLVGYGTYEDSAMASGLTAGNNIMVIGDFRYFKIIDRIGLDIEVIPHLFGSTARYPTGQRGIYAMWRNSAAPLSTAAFRVLQTL